MPSKMSDDIRFKMQSDLLNTLIISLKARVIKTDPLFTFIYNQIFNNPLNFIG